MDGCHLPGEAGSFWIPATEKGELMRNTPHLKAVLQAFLVTFLWSTSWVLIKIALVEIPPLTFAGLRYTFAFLILLPMLWKRKPELRPLSRRELYGLVILGIIYYALTQGGVFLSLKYLDPITFSLMLNFTTVLVALAGIVTLREWPSWWQWIGILIFLVGVLVYFYPLNLPIGEEIGLFWGVLTVCANAAASVLGRGINRANRIQPLVVTVVSMGVGALVLLISGLVLQGLPPISLQSWAIIVWLALVNTAFAFTLWNKTLQTLPAMESSMINNTMLVQIALLAWIFLGDTITPLEVVGLGLATIGVLAASRQTHQ
jgi:drug/metabolite transporter (DMT)-like permease